MWGEDWGSMIWGMRAVPALGPAGVALLIVALGLGFLTVRKRLRARHTLAVGAVLLGALVPFVARGEPVEVPHSFSNATPAQAGEVNANFDALVTESNAKDARLDTLNGRTFQLTNCAYSACTDAPTAALCPAGQIMVGVDLPEFAGNEGSCNPNPTTGPDDFRIRCCDAELTTP